MKLTISVDIKLLRQRVGNYLANDVSVCASDSTNFMVEMLGQYCGHIFLTEITDKFEGWFDEREESLVWNANSLMKHVCKNLNWQNIQTSNDSKKDDKAIRT